MCGLMKYFGRTIRLIWLRCIMGVEGDEGGEVNRANIMKKILGSKVKEFVRYFEVTL